MFTINRLSFSLAPFFLLMLFSSNISSPELRLSLENIQEPRGSIYIAVYDNHADFLSEVKMRDKKIIPVSSAGSLEVVFSNLTAGNYAISCFHDLNGNGKIDTNMFGVPTEPYGFSNNVWPGFRAPYWEEASFKLHSSKELKQIFLKTW
jgi:uncharacterized protein (DUF2141 family)